MAQKKFIIDGGFETNDDSVITGDLTMTGDILPSADNTYDLGSPTKVWKDVYVGPGSLYVNGKKVLEDDSDTITISTDTDQDLRITTHGTGSLELFAQGTGNVQMKATLQMEDGKKITNSAGNPVQFGDKIDMDNNQMINLSAPTADGHAANKTYVDTKAEAYTDTREAAITTAYQAYADSAVADLVNSAPAALDTLNELAEALGDDSNFATTVTTNIASAQTAAQNYADAAVATLQSGGASFTGGNVALGTDVDLTLDTTSQAKFGASVIVGDDPDNAGNPAICASSFRPTAGQADLNLKAGSGGNINLADGDVEYEGVGIVGDDPDNGGNPTVCASTFRPVSGQTDLNLRPGSGGAITLGSTVLKGVATPVATTDAANKAYSDASQAAAEATAASDATTKADAAQAAAEATASADATSKADAAEADAITTAAADATSKADAALASAQTYADSAEADAITTAAADATSKANAALASAQTYADTAEADAINTASADATSKANAAQSAAEATAAADATSKADAAQAAAISAVTNGAGAAFDTLKEIQDAMATDAELTAAISGLTIGDGTITITAGNGMSGGGTFSTNQTGSGSISVAMSGSFTGDFTATGDVTAYSDDTLKTNVQVIDGALGRVEAIRGVTFDRIEDGSTSTGVIAQELEAVLPQAVKTDDNGVRHVAYGNITGLLIEAVKELSAQVAELKK